MAINRTDKTKIYFSGNAIPQTKKMFVHKVEKNLNLFSFKYLEFYGTDSHQETSRNKVLILILIQGSCVITCKTTQFALGIRKGKTKGVVIPPHTPFSIVDTASHAGVAFIYLDAGQGYSQDVYDIPCSRVVKRRVGRGAYQRTVYDIMSYEANDAHLFIGETCNVQGRWSSFPPHKHAVDKMPHETKFEELYFFKLKPEQGFGFLGLYGEMPNSDRAFVVRNNDCAIVTGGYHPVVAAPGCQLSYLWVLAGKHKKVKSSVHSVFRGLQG
jgi:5-deoxy-glucuronate isomerase